MYASPTLTMLRSAVLAALLCLLVGGSPATAQTGSIRGHVLSEGPGVPLRAAVVEVLSPGRPIMVTSDASGEYEITAVPAGRRVIRARHIGHAPLEIEVVVPAGREVRLDLALRIAPVALDPVNVDAGRPSSGIDTLGAPRAELGLAGARALRSSPGIAELGIADVVQGTPGQEPPDPSDVLYVRGAGADLKLVYLDGAPVYAPFPLGGVADPFVPDVLGSATVFLGGAPARYDGGLSYVMDLRTRGVRQDGLHASGAMDLLSGRLMMETPIVPGVGVLAAGRAVHGAGAVDPLPYGYREGLVRLDAGLPGGAHLHVTGFANDEEVWLDESARADSAITWGNTAGSVRVVVPLLGGDLELTGSTGRYGARLPLEGRHPAVADGRSRRDRIAADMSRRHGDVVLRYGVSGDRLTNRYHAALRNGAEVSLEATGGTAGAYAEMSWQASSRVSVRSGLRADHFSVGGELVFAPRLAVTFLPTERASITAAAGRYHQYLRAPDGVVLFPQSDSSAPAVAPLSLGASSHVTVALDQEVSDGMRLGIEGFFKSFEGVPAAPSRDANSSGIDLWLRRDTGRWTGWAGYSLAWVWSVTGAPASDLFTGRHMISAGLGSRIARATRIDGRFAYGSGLPYAAIRVGDALPNSLDSRPELETRAVRTFGNTSGAAPLVPFPDRAYLRLDLSATHSLDRRWGGRDVRIDSYLKLLNTLGRRDALFYRYDHDRAGDLTALAVLPIVPVLGLEWRF